jgi:hypothetical protein
VTHDEATKLARIIPKESSVSVRCKTGQTNGSYLVHVIENDAEDKKRASFNINSAGEWNIHPFHKHNRKRKAEQIDDPSLVEDFVSEVIDAALTRLSRRARGTVANSTKGA